MFFGETGEIADVEQIKLPLQEKEEKPADSIADEVMSQMRSAEIKAVQEVQPPKEMANVLSMEGDGQISFVLPEKEPVEKQITGQISINDIILEWERLKKENEETQAVLLKQIKEVKKITLLENGMLIGFDGTEEEEAGLLARLIHAGVGVCGFGRGDDYFEKSILKMISRQEE